MITLENTSERISVANVTRRSFLQGALSASAKLGLRHKWRLRQDCAKPVRQGDSRVNVTRCHGV